MKIHYTGKIDSLTASLQKKLDARLIKLGKLLDGKSEKEAHVILNAERHLKRAEITVNYLDHQMVGVASHSDSFTALGQALDKLEKQVLKQRELRREPRRLGKPVSAASKQEKLVAPEPSGQRVYRVNHNNRRKPMSVEEAVLEIDGTKNYFVYRDDKTERVSVLVRRPDGHFDLVES